MEMDDVFGMLTAEKADMPSDKPEKPKKVKPEKIKKDKPKKERNFDLG